MLGSVRLAAGGVALLAAVPAFATGDSGSGISFDGIDTIFSFGDSYSTVGYKPQEGLLPLPLLGGTTSGGYNWVQFLAQAQAATNQSYFDFAQSAATVNNSIIHIAGDNVPPSFDMQVAQWEDYFTGNETEVKWTGNGSLFTIFFGINDIGFTGLQGGHNATEIVPRIVASYEATVSKLYEHGARNFLLLLMPPTYRTPYIRSFGEEMGATFVQNIDLYISTLKASVAAIDARYADAVFTFYETAPLFNAVLDQPAAHGFTVSASSCVSYWNTHNPENDLPVCEAPLKDYVWMDDYHPTWSVHKLLAEDILKFLSGNDTSSLAVSSSSSTTTPASAEEEPVIARRAQRQRKPFHRRPAHGSARSHHGHDAHVQAAKLAEMQERMRRRWAGLA